MHNEMSKEPCRLALLYGPARDWEQIFPPEHDPEGSLAGRLKRNEGLGAGKYGIHRCGGLTAAAAATHRPRGAPPGAGGARGREGEPLQLIQVPHPIPLLPALFGPTQSSSSDRQWEKRQERLLLVSQNPGNTSAFPGSRLALLSLCSSCTGESRSWTGPLELGALGGPSRRRVPQ